MALQFGTSGIRGLNSEFSEAEVFALTEAFLFVAAQKFAVSKVMLAGDLRESTPMIRAFIKLKLQELKIEWIDLGLIPTPALALACLQTNLPGIMITGSHIPADRNGIKFYWPWGEVLKSDESEISAKYQELRERTVSTRKQSNELKTDSSFYIDRYLHCFSQFSSDYAGKTVLVFEHSSVARDILVRVLTELGLQVISVGRSQEFIPVDTESPRTTEFIKAELQKINFTQSFFAAVSTDGDGDRPLFWDENLKPIPGDTLGLITALFLKAQTVVTPISSNTSIEMSQKFKQVVRTKIGSPFVIEAMQDEELSTPVLGFEANGGVLLASTATVGSATLTPLPTRDCLLPILSCLTMACQQKQSCSELQKSLPQRFTYSDLLKQIPVAAAQGVLSRLKDGKVITSHFAEVDSTNEIDGLRFTLKDKNIVHFRPSGNAPEFRCYTEANDLETAKKLNQRGLELIQELLRN